MWPQHWRACQCAMTIRGMPQTSSRAAVYMHLSYMAWHDIAWNGMAWHHGVSLVCLCMVPNIVHGRTVLGRHWICCMNIYGDFPLLSYSSVFLLKWLRHRIHMDMYTIHRHIKHHTQAYQWYTMGMAWHDMSWQDMARHDMAWHHGVSSTCLCMVHSIVHSRAVLGTHQRNCMSMSGNYPLLSFSRIFFTLMSESVGWGLDAGLREGRRGVRACLFLFM